MNSNGEHRQIDIIKGYTGCPKNDRQDLGKKKKNTEGNRNVWFVAFHLQ